MFEQTLSSGSSKMNNACSPRQIKAATPNGEAAGCRLTTILRGNAAADVLPSQLTAVPPAGFRPKLRLAGLVVLLTLLLLLQPGASVLLRRGPSILSPTSTGRTASSENEHTPLSSTHEEENRPSKREHTDKALGSGTQQQPLESLNEEQSKVPEAPKRRKQRRKSRQTTSTEGEEKHETSSVSQQAPRDSQQAETRESNLNQRQQKDEERDGTADAERTESNEDVHAEKHTVQEPVKTQTGQEEKTAQKKHKSLREHMEGLLSKLVDGRKQKKQSVSGSDGGEGSASKNSKEANKDTNTEEMVLRLDDEEQSHQHEEHDEQEQHSGIHRPQDRMHIRHEDPEGQARRALVSGMESDVNREQVEGDEGMNPDANGLQHDQAPEMSLQVTPPPHGERWLSVTYSRKLENGEHPNLDLDALKMIDQEQPHHHGSNNHHQQQPHPPQESQQEEHRLPSDEGLGDAAEGEQLEGGEHVDIGLADRELLEGDGHMGFDPNTLQKSHQVQAQQQKLIILHQRPNQQQGLQQEEQRRPGNEGRTGIFDEEKMRHNERFNGHELELQNLEEARKGNHLAAEKIDQEQRHEDENDDAYESQKRADSALVAPPISSSSSSSAPSYLQSDDDSFKNPADRHYVCRISPRDYGSVYCTCDDGYILHVGKCVEDPCKGVKRYPGSCELDGITPTCRRADGYGTTGLGLSSKCELSDLCKDRLCENSTAALDCRTVSLTEYQCTGTTGHVGGLSDGGVGAAVLLYVTHNKRNASAVSDEFGDAGDSTEMPQAAGALGPSADQQAVQPSPSTWARPSSSGGRTMRES
ncbi:hypothetical protein cyc_06637 [Cyclospora cayetanensis]|uniref:Uncharacterized protein n=1 Tax=Cyclospora cayetanensis TaxID=88456 RepID=A0A1D3CQY0_9EIME|nr:hypothetical protein cyc_06637 [Cyclospora cayetanensis]